MDTVLDRFRLDGRVAVVTGGTRGLGKAMAEGLAEAGADVVVCARSTDGPEPAAMSRIACDITVPADVDRLVDTVLQRFGRLDVWINNAGTNIRHPVEDFPLDDFDTVFNTNLRGMWLCCRAVSRALKKQCSGSVINVGSALSAIGLAERTAYCASKAGVLGLTRTLALEWAPFNVRCNALCPGPFLTEINEAIADDPEKVEAVVGGTALKRWAELPEIQGAALFLASDASSYMTGSALYLDGGWTAG